MNQWMDRPESIDSGMFMEDLIIKKCYSASSKKTISNVLTRKIVALCVWLDVQKHFLYCNFVFSANILWQERFCYTNAFQGGRYRAFIFRELSFRNNNKMYEHICCFQQKSLRKKSPYSELSGSYFLAFGLNTEKYSSECGKIRTRITPNTETFYAVIIV